MAYALVSTDSAWQATGGTSSSHQLGQCRKGRAVLRGRDVESEVRGGAIGIAEDMARRRQVALLKQRIREGGGPTPFGQ